MLTLDKIAPKPRFICYGVREDNVALACVNIAKPLIAFAFLAMRLRILEG